jgi:hypothetical protein
MQPNNETPTSKSLLNFITPSISGPRVTLSACFLCVTREALDAYFFGSSSNSHKANYSCFCNVAKQYRQKIVTVKSLKMFVYWKFQGNVCLVPIFKTSRKSSVYGIMSTRMNWIMWYCHRAKKYQVSPQYLVTFYPLASLWSYHNS